MAGFLFKSPSYQLVDANGDVYPGAKINVYLTGTTTTTPSYQDSALGTPHTNPVVADSKGLFAPIYLDPAVEYKIVVTESDDSVIQTIDPVVIDLGTGLTPIRDLTPAANKGIYYTSGTAAALFDLTAYGRSIAGTANEAGFKQLVNLEIGIDVQAWDAHLDDLAAISPAIGDIIYFDGTDWVKLLAGTDSYLLRANGAAAPTWEERANNRAYAETASVITCTNDMPVDDTIPQITEGTQIVSTTFTPTSTTARVRIIAHAWGSNSATIKEWVMAIFDAQTNDAINATMGVTIAVAGDTTAFDTMFEYVPGVATEITVSMRIGDEASGSNTLYVNGNSSGTRRFGGASVASLSIEEIA